MTRVGLVVAAGTSPTAELVSDLTGAFVVAADRGVSSLRALGIVPDVVVGDLDSAPPTDLAWAEEMDAEVRRFPADKDLTDLELALEAAIEAGCKHLVVTGVRGGRPDHELGNIAAIAAAARRVPVETRSGEEISWYVTNRVELVGQPGATLTLIPYGGDAVGVRTDGLRWQLHGETLSPFASRGVSNEFSAASATVELASGMLIVVQPH